MTTDASKATPSEHPNVTMTDKQRFDAIVADISNEKPLNETAYKAFLSEIEQREHNQHSKTMDEAANQVAEGIALTLVDTSTIGNIENLEHAAKGLESVLNKLGPIGFLIANGVGLLSVPWRCYKEKRWPTRDEGIKIGLCVATIVLIAVAMATPVVAAWLVMAAAVIGFVKSVQNFRAKKIELHHILDQARSRHAQITKLSNELDDLQTISKRTDEQQIEYEAKKAELTQKIDQYVRDGHNIRRLKEELQHPLKVALNNINVAMSAVILIGVVVSVFFPPVGLGLLLGGGLVSLATLAISAVSKWFAKRNAPLPIAPVVNLSATQPTVGSEKSEDPPTPRPANEPSSTALEVKKLNDHPPEPVVNKHVEAPLPHPENPTKPAVILPTEYAPPSSSEIVRCETIERNFKSELEILERPVTKKKEEEDEEEKKNEEDMH